MIVDISDTAEEMSLKGRSLILGELENDPDLALGGATGNTPKMLYAFTSRIC